VQFKVGDKVVAIDDKVGRYEDLPADYVYTVTYADYGFSHDSTEWVGLDGDYRSEWQAHSFKLAEPERDLLLPRFGEVCSSK
jgi:hypothetical protein